MMKLLSGVLILEELEIARHFVTGMDTLYVDSFLLERLKIHNLGNLFEMEDKCYKAIVNAPNLEFLEFLNFTCDQEFEMMESPSIVEARIVVGRYYGKRVYDNANEVVRLLRQISNVKVLLLGSRIFQILHRASELLDSRNFNITFHNLTRLEVTSESFISFDMLESMPNLVLLALELGCFTKLSPPKNIPRCLISCLEMVEFQVYSAFKEELAVIKYILENALVLKTMTLSFSVVRSIPVEPNEILSFPRASSSYQILFIDDE